MKKIHLIAAAAALLLSGGVFVKANDTFVEIVISTIEAITQPEYVYLPDAGGEMTAYAENFDIQSFSWWTGGDIGGGVSSDGNYSSTYSGHYETIWCCVPAYGTICHQPSEYITGCNTTGHYYK